MAVIRGFDGPGRRLSRALRVQLNRRGIVAVELTPDELGTRPRASAMALPAFGVVVQTRRASADARRLAARHRVPMVALDEGTADDASAQTVLGMLRCGILEDVALRQVTIRPASADCRLELQLDDASPWTLVGDGPVDVTLGGSGLAVSADGLRKQAHAVTLLSLWQPPSIVRDGTPVGLLNEPLLLVPLERQLSVVHAK